MKTTTGLVAAAVIVWISVQTQAHVMLDGLGGTAGYGDLAMERTDDGSSNELTLPFAINFYGNTFDTFWVNNNGNVSFGGPWSSYTPVMFPAGYQPMIAPYWSDVDTRPLDGGEVYVAFPDTGTAVVTWDNVGYHNQKTDRTNDFQLVLRHRGDIAAGDFDIEFRYDRLEWTTGDASGGSGGLGGTAAEAGYDAGDGGIHCLVLPGSFEEDILNLTNSSNTDTPGLWSFAVRNGETAVVPLPGAVLLGSLGLSFAGWVLRRKPA